MEQTKTVTFLYEQGCLQYNASDWRLSTGGVLSTAHASSWESCRCTHQDAHGSSPLPTGFRTDAKPFQLRSYLQLRVMVEQHKKPVPTVQGPRKRRALI